MNRRERSLTSITLTVASSITLYCLAPLAPVRGQLTPDRTLGAESSIVTPNAKIKGILILME